VASLTEVTKQQSSDD